MKVIIQRVYDHANSGHGWRILVDRLWPRGISREKAPWDEWCKDAAPSEELRKWFNHDPQNWEEFRLRYNRELSELCPQVKHLLALARKQPLTLLYAARDELHNQAVVLRDFLLKQSHPMKRQ